MVLASAGYPGAYEIGLVIKGLDHIATNRNLQVFHAGTSRSEGGPLVTSGGRVLGITAVDKTLEHALAQCYGAINRLDWKGMQYRSDIGRFNEKQKASSYEFR